MTNHHLGQIALQISNLNSADTGFTM